MKLIIATGIYPPDIGGPATYSKLLADELPKHGFEISILPFREVKRWPYIIRHFFYFLKILKRSWGVDIIYAQDPLGTGMPACFAAKILRKKFLIKIVGDRAWETGVQKFRIKDSLDKFSNKWFYFSPVFIVKVGQWLVALLADKIITPSNYLKTIVGSWGINQDKIKVIYNAFEMRGDPISRGRSDLPESDFIIVSSGRLVPWKGFGALIEIMPEILKEIPNAKLFIIGDGPEHKNLKSKILNLKSENSVFLLGQLEHDKLLKYLKSSDIFVLNTAYEGFSHQILEAMAIGIPVITTNAGGNPELIKDGESGLLVEYNNKEQFKKAIISLYRINDLRDKFIENAKNKVKGFSKEKMIKETISVLCES